MILLRRTEFLHALLKRYDLNVISVNVMVVDSTRWAETVRRSYVCVCVFSEGVAQNLCSSVFV